jgi:glycerophosphoryl diester phosphodiesterase
MISPKAPVIYAHRGACACAPENTLAAFELAVQHGADAIELDAKLTVDGAVVVFHDQTIDRTTDGKGRLVDETLAELKKLDAGSWFAPQFAGEPIPTLDEVFELVGGSLGINVELTNYATPNDNLVQQVVNCVIRHRLQEKVLFSSFHPVNLVKARRLLPEVPVAILALAGTPGALARSFVGRWVSPEYVHPYFSDVNERWLQRQHALRRKVNVWTVNQPEMIRALAGWGVDGIITDDPRLARQVLEGSK